MTDVSVLLLQNLKDNGADFFASVPCKLLGPLIKLLGEDESISYVPVTREEEGLGVCAGAYLAGKTPVIVMQNTGLGTIVTSLYSLGLFYHLPLTMIVSHRGSPGEAIGTQVPMSTASRPLMESMGLPTFMFDDASQVAKVGKLVQHAQVAQRPVVALLNFDFWKG
ncbi:MAG: sulfopyruvate decarboxylase subunit alpha [Chloroflexota bacterium]